MVPGAVPARTIGITRRSGSWLSSKTSRTTDLKFGEVPSATDGARAFTSDGENQRAPRTRRRAILVSVTSRVMTPSRTVCWRIATVTACQPACE